MSLMPSAVTSRISHSNVSVAEGTSVSLPFADRTCWPTSVNRPWTTRRTPPDMATRRLAVKPFSKAMSFEFAANPVKVGANTSCISGGKSACAWVRTQPIGKAPATSCASCALASVSCNGSAARPTDAFLPDPSKRARKCCNSAANLDNHGPDGLGDAGADGLGAAAAWSTWTPERGAAG